MKEHVSSYVSSMGDSLLALISTAMTAYLDLDPESRNRLLKLQGKVITIELRPFHFVFQCTFTPKAMHIQRGAALEAQAAIRGTPLQMMGVMLTKDNRHRFFAEDILIEGNAELAQQVTALFDELQIDWEDYLSHVVGDEPAYHVGSVVRRVRKWLRHADDTFTQNVNEYVHEETAWFPAPEALQDFFNDIDVLRMDVDRAEARIQQLHRTLNDDEVCQ